MDTFSNSYIEQLKQLHNDKKRPRGFGGKLKGDQADWFTYFEKWRPLSVLDYGCGKGVLTQYMTETYPNTKFIGYDPAIKMFSKLPKDTFDCVYSNDVLEHIEPDYITNVLQQIDSFANRFIWLRIDTIPARKFLPDGRNAHILLETPDWWEEMLHHNIDGTIVYKNLTARGKLDFAIEK